MNKSLRGKRYITTDKTVYMVVEEYAGMDFSNYPQYNYRVIDLTHGILIDKAVSVSTTMENAEEILIKELESIEEVEVMNNGN